MTHVETYVRNGLLLFLNEKIEIAREELRQQGHRVTGETERSFKAVVTKVGPYNYTGEIFVKTSAVILNFGVTAARVPYGGGRAKTSLYIQALLNWAANVRPELDDKERKSFVFAVAAKAKKEGHPTRGSYAFSKNGRRKKWMDFSVDLTNIQIERFIDPSVLLQKIILDNK
jgi:hypothetical protein